jgi:hypothetical protein
LTAGGLVLWFKPCVLHASTEPRNDAGNTAGAHVAPSARVRHAGTRHCPEAVLDQLNCVQRQVHKCLAQATLLRPESLGGAILGEHALSVTKCSGVRPVDVIVRRKKASAAGKSRGAFDSP